MNLFFDIFIKIMHNICNFKGLVNIRTVQSAWRRKKIDFIVILTIHPQLLRKKDDSLPRRRYFNHTM